MTVDRSSGSARFVMPGGSMPDVWQLADPASRTSNEPPLPGVAWEWIDPPNVGKQRWRVWFTDGRGGLNPPAQGPLEQLHGRQVSSTLDTTYPGQGILAELTTVATTPDPATLTAYARRAYFAHVFGGLAMGLSTSTAGAVTCLFGETSSTNPVVVAKVYNPPDDGGGPAAGLPITGMWNALLGTSYAERLIVGRTDDPADVISVYGSTPTIEGTLAVSTLCGLVQTALPGQPLLAYHGTTSGFISYIDHTAGIAAEVVTEVQDSLPPGGYSLGLCGRGGGPVRAYWNFPKGGTGGFLTDPYYGEIYSTNQDGGDLQPFDVPLPFVTFSGIYRDGIYASDMRQIYWDNGNESRLLDPFINPPVGTIPYPTHKIDGVWCVDRQTLRILVNVVDVSFQIWQYHHDLRTWQVISTVQSPASATAYRGLAGMPYSRATNFMHYYNAGAWYRQHRGSDQNALTTVGQATGLEFAATGGIDWPKLIFPAPYQYCPKLIDAFLYMGDVDSGGTAGTTTGKVTILAGRGVPGGVDYISHGFEAPLNLRSRRRAFTNNTDPFMFLSLGVSAAQQTGGSDPTRKTPNIFPFAIEGHCLDDSEWGSA